MFFQGDQIMFNLKEIEVIINLFDNIKEEYHKEFSSEELNLYNKSLKIKEMLELQNEFTSKQRKLAEEIREISEGKEN